MENNEIPQKPKNKLWLNIALVAVIFVLLIIWIINTNDINEVFEAMKGANMRILLLGVLVMIGYWFLTGMSLHMIIKGKVGKEISTFASYNVSNASFFFNGITPFSSGGQPFQLYYLRKHGIKSANATGILMMNFIIYQIALTIVSTIFLIFFFKDLRTVDNFVILVLVGFTINTLIFLLLVGCAISKKVEGICLWLLHLIFKIKPLKKFEEKVTLKTQTFVKEAQESFKDLFHMKKVIISSLVCQVGALILFYSVPFFVFIALGYQFGFGQFFLICAMTSFINVFMVWIPTPGSSGGAEWGFKTLFVLPVLGISATSAVAGMLLWRLLSYYLSIINGLVSTILLNIHKRSREEEICE